MSNYQVLAYLSINILMGLKSDKVFMCFDTPVTDSTYKRESRKVFFWMYTTLIQIIKTLSAVHEIPIHREILGDFHY